MDMLLNYILQYHVFKNIILILGKLTSLGVEFTEALWIYLIYWIWQPCITNKGWNLIVNCITWWVLMHLYHALSAHHMVLLVELCSVMVAPAPPRQNGATCAVVAVGGGIWCFEVLAITPLLLGGPISHEGAWVVDEDSSCNKLLNVFPRISASVRAPILHNSIHASWC